MSSTPSNTDDIIQTSDIIERIEELESELEDLTDVANDANEKHSEAIAARSGDVDSWHGLADANKALAEWNESAEAEELKQLNDFMEEMQGNGGDEQWRGNWYPQSVIRESYFESAMDEILEDIGEIPKDLPSYLTIAVDYDALRMDYMGADFDGVTYYFR